MDTNNWEKTMDEIIPHIEMCNTGCICDNKDIKQFISDLLIKEQNRWHNAGWEDACKEWLSCLPEKYELQDDNFYDVKEGINYCLWKFLQNAKAKKLIS